MFTKRHQQNWKKHPNNSILYSHAKQQDIKNIYSFWQNFNDYLSEFVFNTIDIQKNIKFAQNILIVDNQENLHMLLEIIKEQKFIFIDIINQIHNSYKGYITYIIIATYNQLYLIDSAKLHDQCYLFKPILENKALVKFMHECQQILDYFKRDFQIFIPNIFDLQVIQRYLVKKGKLSILPKQKFKQYIYGSGLHHTSIRPPRQEFLWQIKQYYQQQMNFLINLDKFFSTQDPQYQCYAYFNHYELLCKSYYHHVPTVMQIDEMLKLKNQKKDKSFNQYKRYHQIGNIKQIHEENYYWMKQKQECQIAQSIYEWRQHMAKIRDISSQQFLPYQTISNISKSNINSVLQISQIYNNKFNYRTFSLSIQQFQQILELIYLYRQQKQQLEHQLVIPKRIPYYKTNQQKPIKKLFEELKFTDLTNQWLNKKNDDSIKLYKQILSINQFDNSIVEEYLIEKENFGENQPQECLQIEDINRFIKYAEYLRNGNHKKLQQLYQRQKNKKQQIQSHLEQLNFIQDQQSINQNYQQSIDHKNWDDIQNEINFPTMDTINQVKSNTSLTSFKNHSQVQINSCKILPNKNSSISILQNKMNSLNLIQSPNIYQNKLKPFPLDIENIYLEAAKAKKIHNNKGLKKTNKNNKKEQKTNVESNKIKKDQELIPTKQQIFNLIYY